MYTLYENNVQKSMRAYYSDKWLCFNLLCFPFLSLYCQRKSRKSSLWVWRAIQGTLKQLLLHSNSRAATPLASWGRFHGVGYLCFHPSSGRTKAVRDFLFGRQGRYKHIVRAAVQYINLPMLNFHLLSSTTSNFYLYFMHVGALPAEARRSYPLGMKLQVAVSLLGYTVQSSQFP